MMNDLDRKRLEIAMETPESYVPEHTRHALLDYVQYGHPVGGFLTAVLENNLKEAFGRADNFNAASLRSIVCWLYNYAPAHCWGRQGAMEYYRECLAKAKEQVA